MKFAIRPLPSFVKNTCGGNQYHYERKVNLKTSTDGGGLWSIEKKDIRIIKFDLNWFDVNCFNDNFNYFELRAYWDKRTWSVKKHGLVYTDELWLKTLKNNLINLGFSKIGLKGLTYSEQGLQGNDYVGMDVYDKHSTPVFAKDYERVFYNVKERFLGSLNTCKKR
jgi:hypothetical protein